MLLLSVVVQAMHDACDGDTQALAWLRAEGLDYAETYSSTAAIGLEHWLNRRRRKPPAVLDALQCP